MPGEHFYDLVGFMLCRNICLQRRKENRRSTKVEAQFEATLQAEREEAARKHEQSEAQILAQQASLEANQAALEENKNLLCQTQEEVRGMHTKFEETNALLRAMLKLYKD